VVKGTRCLWTLAITLGASLDNKRVVGWFISLGQAIHAFDNLYIDINIVGNGVIF
jgi:hypothetical protein